MSKIAVDCLKDLYFKVKNNYESEEEAMKRDLTPLMDQYIKEKINKGELIVINIRGEVGTGKSTIALELMRRVNIILEKKFDKKIDNYNCIASDQIEFNRMTRSEQTHVCVEIDEFSQLGETGANSTTEQAITKFYSDVCRANYVHRISATPARITDDNAHIVLDVEGNDKDMKTTFVRVTYRYSVDQDARILGAAELDVSKTLTTKWYERYEKKKMQRIALFREVGVRDIRDLFFAKYKLLVTHELKELVMKEKKAIYLVETKIQNMLNKEKELMSLIATEEIVRPIKQMLNAIHTYSRIEDKNIRNHMKKEIDEGLKYWSRLNNALHDYLNIK